MDATIDMKDPLNRRRALDLAKASTDPTGFGEMDTKWIHGLAGDSEKLWSAFFDDNHPDGCLVVAVTGNGPTSEANAEFLASARKVVLGLLEEIDRLETVARNSGPLSTQKGCAPIQAQTKET